MGCKKKTNDESGTPRSQSGWKTSWDKKDDKEINVHASGKTLQTLTNGAKRKLRLSGWKTSWDKKDDKEDQCASRVEDSSNTNQWGKKEAASGKWAAKRKLMMRVGPLVLSLDGKLLGTRRMTKKINVHPEWLTLQTLTNGAKRKLHLVNGLQMGCKKKTNDESGTPCSQSGWKTSWDKKDDKEDQCASRVEDSSNTNQWGKKEAASVGDSSNPNQRRQKGSASGKGLANGLQKDTLMMRSGTPAFTSGWKTSLRQKECAKKINVHPEWKTLQTLTNELAW
ncbi:hypothetical protein Tco_0710899 [Tanacetum coccineum]